MIKKMMWFFGVLLALLVLALFVRVIPSGENQENVSVTEEKVIKIDLNTLTASSESTLGAEEERRALKGLTAPIK